MDHPLLKITPTKKNTIAFLCALLFFYAHTNAQQSFSGELTYRVTEINSNEIQASFSAGSVKAEEKMIIYAKDSLLKIVTINSVTGIQENLQHLRLGKKIALINVDSLKYAIQLPPTDFSNADPDRLYELEKKCFPKRNFGGLKGKPMILKHPLLENDLQIWISKKIHNRYNSVYENLEGIPIKYYIVSEKGLFLYELEEYKRYEPSLSLFQIPLGSTIISLEDFLTIMKASE